MAFMDFLFGKGERTQRVPKYNQQQSNALSEILSNAQGQVPQIFDYLSSLLSQSPEALQQFQAPSLRAFEEQTLPTIAERFTGSFGTGSNKSSAFGQQLGQAGAALQENLAAQKAGLSMESLGPLLSLLQLGLNPQFESVIRPGTSGLLGGLLERGSAGLGSGLGYLGAQALGNKWWR